jgi:hypothetical protein
MQRSSNEHKSVLIHTPKGLITISHLDNIMIVETTRVNLFKRAKEITLREDITVIKDSISLYLTKGMTGHFKFGRVYFKMDEGFIGLGREYIAGKTDYALALA